MNAIDFLFAAALDIAKSSSAKYDDYDEDDYANESFSDKVTRYGVKGAAKLHGDILEKCNKKR